MDEYQIAFARSARKELEGLPNSTIARVLQRIERLSTIPRPPGIRKLTGSDNLWRLRVGDYRVIYGVDDANQVIDVVAVRHRRDAYR